jgi:pimeloyl-ACP methyl ester carboxylesterase
MKKRTGTIMHDNDMPPPPLSALINDVYLSYLSQQDNQDNVIRDIFPYGDGAPAMVVPGFMAHDKITAPLGEFISSLGYAGKKWKGGLHLGVSDYKLQHFSQRLEHVYKKHGERPVTLIGWSLGGIVSREMARQHPEMVAQVITMGSPIKALSNPNSTHLKGAFDFATALDQKLGASQEILRETPEVINFHLNPKNKLSDKFILAAAYPLSCAARLLKQPRIVTDTDFTAQIASPVTVPCTHIYTQKVGVVHWQTCIDDETRMTENIEVRTSHIGLPFDAAVRLIIADRLHHNSVSQNDDWARFEPSIYKGLFDFPETMAHQLTTPPPPPKAP